MSDPLVPESFVPAALPEAAPVFEKPPIPLAGPREQLAAKVMFFGACVAVLPTAAATLYSCILISVVFPVVITGLLNWCGWWLLLNYRRRGWHRPMRTKPGKVWTTSLAFNAVGLLGTISWSFQLTARSWNDGVILIPLVCCAWMLVATIASGVALLELHQDSAATPREASA